MIGNGQPNKFPEQLLSYVGDHPVPDIVHEIVLPVVEDAFEHRHEEERDRKDEQEAFVLVDENLVKDRFDEPGIGAGEGRHQPRAHERRTQPNPIGLQVANQSYQAI